MNRKLQPRLYYPPSLEAEAPRSFGYAGFASRFLAMVIDLLIILTIWVISAISITFIIQTSGIVALIHQLEGFFTWITPVSQNVISIIVDFTSLVGIGQLYFTFLYSFGGASLGKHIMGLRVVRHNGQPLRFGHAVLRTLAYAVSVMGLYAGFFNVLIDDRRRAWHDILVGTVVIHSWRDYPAAEEEG